MTTFAEAATEGTVEDIIRIGEFPNGALDIVIAVPVGGHIAYLSAIDIDPGTVKLEHVRLTEFNGSPIFDLDAKFLKLIGNRIPLEFRDDGWGCLPNMSTVNCYRLHIRGTGLGDIKLTYHGRELPEPGEPCIPPYVGTIQRWSQAHFIHHRGRRQFQPVNRVGNYIRELIVLFERYGTSDPKRIKRQDVGNLSTRYDLIDLPNNIVPYSCTRLEKGAYHIKFETPLGIPTVQATYLGVSFDLKHPGLVSLAVNDVFAVPQR